MLLSKAQQTASGDSRDDATGRLRCRIADFGLFAILDGEQMEPFMRQSTSGMGQQSKAAVAGPAAQASCTKTAAMHQPIKKSLSSGLVKIHEVGIGAHVQPFLSINAGRQI